ncbi:MAG TPA: tyrosine-type recombinase/integrase, partial [Clostridia bacterium]|nr:tyrosine-type recombinase/integrase [Clostridia bacterium]
YINNDREKSNYSKSEYLIISQRSKKMSREAINRITKRIKKYVGCNVYPHKFRHYVELLIMVSHFIRSTNKVI